MQVLTSKKAIACQNVFSTYKFHDCVIIKHKGKQRRHRKMGDSNITKVLILSRTTFLSASAAIFKLTTNIESSKLVSWLELTMHSCIYLPAVTQPAPAGAAVTFSQTRHFMVFHLSSKQTEEKTIQSFLKWNSICTETNKNEIKAEQFIKSSYWLTSQNHQYWPVIK